MQFSPGPAVLSARTATRPTPFVSFLTVPSINQTSGCDSILHRLYKRPNLLPRSVGLHCAILLTTPCMCIACFDTNHFLRTQNHYVRGPRLAAFSPLQGFLEIGLNALAEAIDRGKQPPVALNRDSACRGPSTISHSDDQDALSSPAPALGTSVGAILCAPIRALVKPARFHARSLWAAGHLSPAQYLSFFSLFSSLL